MEEAIDVFFSWGSPDRPLAEELAARLKSAGLNVFFSATDMPAESAQREVVRVINEEARAAVIAVSDDSVVRDWVRDEVAWCVQARANSKARLNRVIPVLVGPLAEKNWPQALGDANRFDLVDPGARELNLQRVISEVLRALGGEAPIVIPGALFALDQQGFEQLWNPGNAYIENLRELLVSVGMDGHPDWRVRLRALLSPRYGDDPHDFSPFPNRPPLKRVVEDAVHALNARRRELLRRPIWIRWDTSLLMDSEGRKEQGFVEERRASSCLTIVDAISACHDSIRDALLWLPSSSVPTRSGLVWVPPFFRDATAVEDLIRGIANASPPQLRDAYLDWADGVGGPTESRWVAFHTATPSSLRQWLRHALSELAEPPGPMDPNRRAMTARFQTNMSTQGFFFN